MLVKIKSKNWDTGEEIIKEEDVEVLFKCKHVEDTENYDKVEDVKFCDYNIIIARPKHPTCYGFYCLWDNGDGTYERNGLGHSGACSIITALLQKIKDMEATIQSEYGA